MQDAIAKRLERRGAFAGEICNSDIADPSIADAATHNLQRAIESVGD